MAAGLSTAVTFKPLLRSFSSSSDFRLRHSKLTALSPPLPSLRFKSFSVCYVVEERRQSSPIENDERPEESTSSTTAIDAEYLALRLAEKLERKKSERFTYLIAAVLSSFGITSMAVMAVYYRFSWQMEGGEISMLEMFGTFALSVGAAVGMEFWARWAHRALWHASLWNMHESHHKPREGPFELNDVFAIVNAVPAIGLLSYGFFNKGLVPGLCFGAGLGITVFGIAYMFVHDGLVHKRFPVGPIADVPYLRKVAAAHQLHHTDKFNGVPYGLFLGPMELEEVGGNEELDKEISRRIKSYKKSLGSGSSS
ncbi:PREDICTED: beta-carotene 3-hydroxylase 1, chloroplastic [Camelina sativa]|uniref:beta-carotene 3-hydroxylase n=1 Tax=Camelina sativa TaxID=90675 RepID=A0ABM0UZ14_CAMSA|nr:PREDICTED: beta-carotene 3-hydroxylase 1, chloroplastic [Camelina sativa]